MQFLLIYGWTCCMIIKVMKIVILSLILSASALSCEDKQLFQDICDAYSLFSLQNERKVKQKAYEDDFESALLLLERKEILERYINAFDENKRESSLLYQIVKNWNEACERISNNQYAEAKAYLRKSLELFDRLPDDMHERAGWGIFSFREKIKFQLMVLQSYNDSSVLIEPINLMNNQVYCAFNELYSPSSAYVRFLFTELEKIHRESNNLKEVEQYISSRGEKEECLFFQVVFSALYNIRTRFTDNDVLELAKGCTDGDMCCCLAYFLSHIAKNSQMDDVKIRAIILILLKKAVQYGHNKASHLLRLQLAYATDTGYQKITNAVHEYLQFLEGNDKHHE